MAKVSDFFIYEVAFLGIAAGAVATQVLQFDASSNFDWLFGSYSADVAAAGVTESSRVYPLANVLITPTDTSSQFMNQSVPLVHFFGNGENPFPLPAPRRIPANSSVNFQLTNRDAAQTYNIYLSLIGIKRYLN